MSEKPSAEAIKLAAEIVVHAKGLHHPVMGTWLAEQIDQHTRALREERDRLVKLLGPCDRLICTSCGRRIYDCFTKGHVVQSPCGKDRPCPEHDALNGKKEG